ncbi:MAG TPA: hypothetical protein VGX68_03935 [Thermoanaerobaculia bacterium]|jgi:hypothetical protein|nr:hypothetical protein [Thermoanaerobaculia bacterium]
MSGDRDQDLAKRYLLGELPSEERERVEARYLEDETFFQVVVDAEARLLDAYEEGGLTEEERRHFEAYYLASPLRRRRAEVVRDLGELAGVASTAIPPPTVRPARDWRGRPVWIGAAAAGLVVLLGWAVIGGLRLDSTQTASRPPIMLTPGRSRGGDGMELDRPREGQLVLELALRPPFAAEPPASYALTLETADGRAVWRRSGLRAKAMGHSAAVLVSIPDAFLKPDDYVLRLEAVTPRGESIRAGEYFFRLVDR